MAAEGMEGDMTDRKTVLKFAHLGRGCPLGGRHREILDEQRRAFEAHVSEIQAEHERLNAVRPNRSK